MGSSLSDEVQGWEQLQPRILVLASLLIQCFLFISAPMRKRQIPGLLRVFIWLAYLGSDAVALYALTTLVSRQEKGSKAGPQVFWVPILLVHLGGQEAITAYNIEDNERWRDHVQTAVLKISVAINVFVKNYPWSSSDVGIFVTGVLLLLCGITKCVCKPWDLKRVSINSLRPDSTAPAEEGEINSLHEYVRAAAQCVQEQADHGRSGVQPSDGICKVHDVWKTYNLRADVAPLYSGRLSCLKHLVHINPDEAHRLVQSGLSATFDRLYTKESLKLHDASSLNLTSNAALNRWKVLTSAVGIRSVAAAVLLWVTVLFFNRDRDSNDKPADVAITRALLFCALVMECVVPLGFDSFDRIKQWRLNANRWPDQVAQYNLVGYLARNKKHSWLMKMATCLVGADLLDQLWCMRSSKSSHQITRLVHGHVARAWTEGHVGDAEAFRAFNDCRGQWTLDRDDTLISTSKHLRAGVSRPFDESVLLWHLATDFCFFRRGPPSCEAAGRCREMSNYMAYLLFVKPEMMMAGARRCLFRDAYGELVRILRENAHPHAGRDERGLANKVMQVVKGDRQGSSVVHQAWRMADDLMALHGGNEQGMWAVVQGVWVEMLCFSAGRCTGYLHLKSLGTGGEYMSYVWLLLLYMGMETLSEKMQRTELYEAATCRTSAAATAAFNDHNV